MLEKARLKGKKGGQPNASQPSGNGGGNGGDDEFEDDSLCCTCGQKVGQHSHVPAGSGGGTQTQKSQKSLDGGQGPGIKSK